MRKDKAQAEERHDIALERIAAEKRARTGRLDLGNLGLTRPLRELLELDWLEELRLGGVVKYGEAVYRRLDTGSLEETDEAYNPNRIQDLAPSLIALPRLRTLDCSGADLHDLTSLAGLSALRGFGPNPRHALRERRITPAGHCGSIQCPRREGLRLAPLTHPT